jgi:Cu2+-exporting ATPase
MNSAVLNAKSISDGGPFAVASIKVPDIRCAACALKIERELTNTPGIVRCRTSLATKTVVVDYVDVDVEDIVAEIKSLGFSPLVSDDDEAQVRLTRDARKMLARLGVAGIGMMQVMMFALVSYVAGSEGIEPAYEKLMHWASFAMATPVAFYSASPFHRGALQDLKRFNLGMDVPVSIAIVAAYLVSTVNVLNSGSNVYFDSVCMFTFFLLIGRYIELSSRRKYQDGVDLGERCLPATATLAESNALVPISEIELGDLVRVRAGELVSVDGIVTEGKTSVSEMAFTGESLPISKKAGARVLAGSENIDGEIIVEASVTYEEFVIKKMSQLYTDSTLYKPKFSILADRVAQYFVAVILTLAAITAITWYLIGSDQWFTIALTVLVVSCPCALSLATPVAYTVAVASLRKFGIVVSNGEFLEKLADTNRIVFDKTGTLTTGKLTISRVNSLSTLDENRILQICASLEKISRHPIARAFEFVSLSKIENAKYFAGAGVSALIDGIEYKLGKPEFALGRLVSPPDEVGIWILLAGTKPLAWVNLSDELRENAASFMAKLSTLYKTSMLTGDSLAEATRVAKLLSIGDYSARATPEDKVGVISSFQAQGDRVLMVGDGINDAAAMGRAHTSVAVSPVDIVVQEAADATLLQNDITRLSTLLRFSKQVRNVIRQNVSWALTYNLLVIPLAVSGYLEPWMAALGMSLSSLLVVLNANRLRWIGEV